MTKFTLKIFSKNSVLISLIENIIFISYIQKNSDKYVETLREAVAIQSVSAWTHKRDECQRMMEWMADKLRAIGTQIEMVDVGKQILSDGSEIKLPNVIFGTLGTVNMGLNSLKGLIISLFITFSCPSLSMN